MTLMTSHSTEKSQMRQKIRALRQALSHEKVAKKSRAICDLILATPEYKDSKCIAVYLSFDNEVDLSPLIDDSFNKRRVLCPRILTGHKMELREIMSWNDLSKNSVGILEPGDKQALAKPSEADLILVPGIAFDQKGHRLGLGAGYYDRFLKDTAGLKWGIAYDFQVVDQVPTEQHDHQLDRIIYDQR